MAFSDVLKEMASKAGEAASDLGEKGKGFMNKAGAKAQDLGERGVLMLDIKQLEGQIKKLTDRLGMETYLSLVEEKVDSITINSPQIRETLKEISVAKERIEQKKLELQERGN
ncbi:MAG: hypothetical protein LBD79_09615 [Treponema sp.]|jgi:hypothetical protein|nr:hypothetical protein [Treponema sp.]